MRNIFSTILFGIFSLACFSQQNHFIYLQTENKQPFYVKLDNKVYSSSATGYIILSKLTDGEYKIIIGFPKHVAPEQAFDCAIDKKDLGFLVKDFGDKGWGLFNLQTMDVTMAGDVLVKRSAVSRKKTDDAFSNMLANVVHDSSINQKEDLKEEPPKVAEGSKIIQPVVEVVVKKDSVVKVNPGPASGIKRTLSKKNKDGLQLIYVDQNDNGKDTVRIFMPLEKPEKVKLRDTLQVMKPQVEQLNEVKVTENKAVRTEPSGNTDNAVAQSMPVPGEAIKPVQNRPDTPVAIKPAPENKQGLVMINSDCRAVATEDDFLKLRKKMASENNEENMLKVARKTFKTKCFTTEQVKNLSPLFLKDDGKYTFFEIVYPFVSDSGQFGNLESQLTDQHYINRFRAMVQK